MSANETAEVPTGSPGGFPHKQRNLRSNEPCGERDRRRTKIEIEVAMHLAQAGSAKAEPCPDAGRTKGEVERALGALAIRVAQLKSMRSDADG